MKDLNREKLCRILDAGESGNVQDFLNSLSPSDAAGIVSQLDKRRRERLFRTLSSDSAVDLIQHLPLEQVTQIARNLDPVRAASILERWPHDRCADVLERIPTRDARAILKKMNRKKAEQTKRLMAYPGHSAGGLMTSEFLAYPQSWTVGRIVDDLRRNRNRYAGYNVQYVYTIGKQKRLAGVLRLRDLLLTPRKTRLKDIMVKSILFARTDDRLETIAPLFHERQFMGLPVLDLRGRMVGVVGREDVAEALGDSANKSFLKMSGILGGEESRSMPLPRRLIQRLSWLSLNIMLNIMAASVIALYQETLSAAVVLAVFLPIISDMSGCSGFQAVAVSVRELTLGLVRTGEFIRVLSKEVLMGLVNGLVLGVLIGAVALAWKGNPYLGLVVGSALALNTLLSVCLGGVLPLFIRRLGMDPALASGPILTTVTDMCGFFFVLAFASALLPRIAG